MPEHQEQQATVTGFMAAAPIRLDELFNLAPGEVLAVAAFVVFRTIHIRPPRASIPAPVAACGFFVFGRLPPRASAPFLLPHWLCCLCRF
jgi:hypothetical protein